MNTFRTVEPVRRCARLTTGRLADSVTDLVDDQTRSCLNDSLTHYDRNKQRD